MFENSRPGSEEPDRLDNDIVRHCTQMFSDSFAGAESPRKAGLSNKKFPLYKKKNKNITPFTIYSQMPTIWLYIFAQ